MQKVKYAERMARLRECVLRCCVVLWCPRVKREGPWTRSSLAETLVLTGGAILPALASSRDEQG